MFELTSQARELSSQNLEIQSTLRSTLQVSRTCQERRDRERREWGSRADASSPVFSMRWRGAGGSLAESKACMQKPKFFFCTVLCWGYVQTPKGWQVMESTCPACHFRAYRQDARHISSMWVRSPAFFLFNHMAGQWFWKTEVLRLEEQRARSVHCSISSTQPDCF